MAASHLRMVVYNTEETERDLEELVQLLLKVLHTSEKNVSSATVVNINWTSVRLPLVSGALAGLTPFTLIILGESVNKAP